MTSPERGVVVMFNTEQLFGFISPCDREGQTVGEDVFFHLHDFQGVTPTPTGPEFDGLHHQRLHPGQLPLPNVGDTVVFERHDYLM